MKLLPWDSEFFGHPIARADLPPADLDDAVAAAHSSGASCLYLFVPGDHVGLVEACVRRGARLVDLRVELDRVVDPASTAVGPPVRPATVDELGDLESSAEDLAHVSRFAADPRFAADHVRDMYRTWLRWCSSDGVVVVPETGSSGFVGARVVDDETHVDLVYVAPHARGQGLAAALVDGALRVTGAPHASVVTQCGNVAAQRLYQSLGFKTRAVHAVLHLWLDEATGG